MLFTPIVVFGLLACTSAQRTSRAGRSAAVAIVMEGGGVPTAGHVAEVYTAMRPEIARLGYVMAADPRSAEVVVHVKFKPDLSGAGGRVSILNVASTTDQRQQAMAARDEFKESSAKAIRSQMIEPR